MATRPIRLSVPETELPGLRALAHASVDVLEKLADALALEKPSLEPGALARAVAERSRLDPSAVEEVVLPLWRLALVQRRFELGADELLKEIGSGLREIGAERWTEDDAKAWSGREELIKRILAPDGTMASAAKARELLFAQQFFFCDARILTDVRPMFDERAEDLRAFVPFHTLALTYHEGEEVKTIHIAMDLAGLLRLAEVVKRAQQKESLLRTDLEKSGISVVRREVEPDA